MNQIKPILLGIALLLASAALLSAGCSALQRPHAADPHQPKEVRLTEKEGACGSGVGLNVGDTLELVMESNLAGYVWDIGFNVPAVLKVTGQPSHGSDSRPSGTDTFHLTAVAEGEEVLRLLYHIPLDETAPHTRICDVQVTVGEYVAFRPVSMMTREWQISCAACNAVLSLAA